jgi:hypothetical protein
LDGLREAYSSVTTRASWSEFILSAGAVKLLTVGSDAAFATAHSTQDEAIRDFVTRLKRRGDEKLVRYVYYLIQPAVSAFVKNDLQELLRSITRDTILRRFTVHGAVRGKIDWPATLRIRAGGSADPSTFVVRRAHRSADRPENQLLKFLLDTVLQMLADVERLGGTTTSQFAEMRELVRIALKHPFLRYVTLPKHPTVLMRQRATRHRNVHYSTVVELAEQAAAVRQRKWAAVLPLLRQGWLSPLSNNDLFELYALVLTIEVLRQELGFEDLLDWGVIRRGRRHVARLRRSDGAETKVFFDQSPITILNASSEYMSIVKSYDGVNGIGRRPDMMLLSTNVTGMERRLLLEIKRTDDDEYTRSSIYKVLGYLRDFSGTWSGLEGQSPKAVLFFPDEIKLKHAEPVADLALVGATDRMRLAALFRRALEGM